MLDRRRDPLVVARLHPRERRRARRPPRQHDRHRGRRQQREARVAGLDVGQQEPVHAPRGREPLVGGQRHRRRRRGRSAAAARSRPRSACSRSRTGSAGRTSRPPAARRSGPARARRPASGPRSAPAPRPTAATRARAPPQEFVHACPDETPGRSLTANDTAAAETPARRATSAIVGRRRGGSGAGDDIAVPCLTGYPQADRAYPEWRNLALRRFGEEACGGRDWSRSGMALALLPATAQAARAAVGDEAPEGPARGRGRHARVLDRLRGRPLLRQRLAHHGRDGRHLGAAAQARRRHLVRHRRRLGRAGDEVHQRPRLRPVRAAAGRTAC